MLNGLVGRTVTVTSVLEATPGHYAVVCTLEKGEGKDTTGAGEQVIFWTSGAQHMDAEMRAQALAVQQQAQQLLQQ